MEHTTSTSTFDSFEHSLSSVAYTALRSAAKWATILAVLGFIGLTLLALMAVTMLAAGNMVSEEELGVPVSMTALGGIYAAMVVLYFLPVFYMYKFGAGTKHAIDTNNKEALSKSLIKLKSYFKSTVIIIVLSIIIYFIAATFFAVGMASQM